MTKDLTEDTTKFVTRSLVPRTSHLLSFAQAHHLHCIVVCRFLSYGIRSHTRCSPRNHSVIVCGIVWLALRLTMERISLMQCSRQRLLLLLLHAS